MATRTNPNVERNDVCFVAIERRVLLENHIYVPIGLQCQRAPGGAGGERHGHRGVTRVASDIDDGVAVTHKPAHRVDVRLANRFGRLARVLPLCVLHVAVNFQRKRHNARAVFGKRALLFVAPIFFRDVFEHASYPYRVTTTFLT